MSVSFRMRSRHGLLPALSLLILLAAAVRPAWGGDYPTIVRATLPFGSYSLEVRSEEKDGLLRSDVGTSLGEPFADLRDTLSRPQAWCEFLPLVFNVKSCTSHERDGRTELTLYVGRKFFETPEEAIRLTYSFQVRESEKDRLRVVLSAPEGAFGTRDYRIELEARPAGSGRTFIRMHSSFRPSLRSKLATQAYLATSGREKIGFSVAGRQGKEPVYVGGLRGIIERNAMRYYLALQAFIDTQHLPEKERFNARLHAWYDMTARYPQQLYEMDKETYLNAKRQERRYQLQLQLQRNLG